MARNRRGADWTYTETQILMDNYAKVPIEDLEKMLPEHSRKSIYRKIEKLRLKDVKIYKNPLLSKIKNIKENTQRPEKEGKDWSKDEWGSEENKAGKDFGKNDGWDDET